jgi:hypothetical protein
VTTYLQAWVCELDYPNILEIAADATKHLQNAIAEQNDIVWHQWFGGQISATWSELYNLI